MPARGGSPQANRALFPDSYPCICSNEGRCWSAVHESASRARLGRTPCTIPFGDDAGLVRPPSLRRAEERAVCWVPSWTLCVMEGSGCTRPNLRRTVHWVLSSAPTISLSKIFLQEK